MFPNFTTAGFDAPKTYSMHELHGFLTNVPNVLSAPNAAMARHLPYISDSSTHPQTGIAIGCALFIIGLFGMVFNYKNFLVTMMCIEIMYLGAVTSFVVHGLVYSDTTATIYGLLILIFAACESAVGLGLLVNLYRFGRSVGFSSHASLGG